MEIDILFFNSNGAGFREPPNLASVCFLNGNIHYTRYNPTEKELEKLYDEPYLEAKEIVDREASCSIE